MLLLLLPAHVRALAASAPVPTASMLQGQQRLVSTFQSSSWLL
jgi:hypothetical protein